MTVAQLQQVVHAVHAYHGNGRHETYLHNYNLCKVPDRNTAAPFSVHIANVTI